MYRFNVVIAGIMFFAWGCMMPAEGDLAVSEDELAQGSLDAENLSLLPVELDDEAWEVSGDVWEEDIWEDALAPGEDVSSIAPHHGKKVWKCWAKDHPCSGHCPTYHDWHPNKKDRAEHKVKQKCKKYDKCKITHCKYEKH